jgi:uncharacterized protein YceH (UPF0502 family)
MHLLAGAPSIEIATPGTTRAAAAERLPEHSELQALKASVERLEAEVAELRQAVASLRAQADTSEP